MDGRTNLVGLTRDAICELVAPHVDRGFRAKQVAHWVVARNCCDFAEMSNLPTMLRERLAAEFTISEPTITQIVASVDGSRKYLFTLDDGVVVEGVAMWDRRKATLCLSSQAGCAVGCSFCVTGALGAGRNLRAAEMVGQYRAMSRTLDPTTERVNLVFMGMGEPLLNTKELGRALEVLYETISPRRITVSTAGILPGIEWLAGLPRRPKLAVSLNAPNQEIRQQIMPISRSYPLTALVSELRRFPLERGRRITFEYVLIRGLNDRPEHARELSALLHGIPNKLNLIPLNEDPELFPELARPDEQTVNSFAHALREAGHVATVRWSKGRDVAAACGQLKGRRAAPAER